MQKKYNVEFSTRGKKDLKTFRKRYWKSYLDFMTVLPALELDPYGVGVPLKGAFKGLYSLHFGRKPECRAMYKIADEMVIVFILRIGTRENFYDIF